LSLDRQHHAGQHNRPVKDPHGSKNNIF
jgi:hypothetical protein